jgi:hypothetical protein
MGDGEKAPKIPAPAPPPLPKGTTILIGDPIHVGGARPWVCIGKVRMRFRGTPEEQVAAGEPDPSETAFIRTGFGNSAAESKRDVVAQLSRTYGPPDRSMAVWTGLSSEAIKDAANDGWWSKLFRK